MQDGPIFVVGSPRSGTGMLRDALRSHPRISIPPETHFIPRLAAVGDPRNEAAAIRLGELMLGIATVRRWELDLSPELFADCRSYAEAIDRLFSEFARSQGKERWGDKTPQHVAQLPLLGELFPEARFIHIIRDGRDVARSWLTRVHGPQNWFAAARDWKHYVESGQASGVALGERYAEVRYEALLTDPEGELRRLCDFLEERWNEEVLSLAPRTPIYRYSSRSGYEPGRRKAIDPSRAQRWPDALSRSERAIVESVAGDLLEQLDYPIEGLARPLPAARRAAWTAEDQLRRLAAKRKFTQFSVRDVATLSISRARSRLRRRGRPSAPAQRSRT